LTVIALSIISLVEANAPSSNAPNPFPLHPAFDSVFMNTVCNYTGTPPTVTVYDTKNACSQQPGPTLVQQVVCGKFVPFLSASTPDQHAVTHVACSTTGNAVSINITIDNGEIVQCKFNVQIATTCPVTPPMKKSTEDALAQAPTNDSTGACYQRLTLDACMTNCVPGAAGSGETLSQCPCIWNPPNSTISMGQLSAGAPTTCPAGEVCCYDLPCAAYTGNQTACLISGGGSADMSQPSNCQFNNGVCSCASTAGLNPANLTLFDLDNDANLVAPFDCTCSNVGLVAEGGVCVNPSGTTGQGGGSSGDLAIIAAIELALTTEVQALAQLTYTLSCHPCSVTISPNAFVKDLTSICYTLQKETPFVCKIGTPAHGCTVTAPAGHCDTVVNNCNRLVNGADVSVVYDLSDVQSSASSIAVVVLVYVVALLATLL